MVIWLGVVYGATTLVQLLVWGRWLRWPTPPQDRVGEAEPVSVIVCARNEARQLTQNLPVFLRQQYPPGYELIVVDDGSTDNTQEVLARYGSRYPHLVSLHLTEHQGKKSALAQGIAAARHRWLLLSDADCQPMSRRWISEMVRPLRAGKHLVLGYGAYQPGPGLLNALIRYETVVIALQYGAFAKAGSPYMGVGRNMAYHRSVYETVGGFAEHAHIRSGDDDLLVQAAGQVFAAEVIFAPDAWTISPAKQIWSAYFRQKSRHLSTSGAYRLLHQVKLGLIASSHMGHFVFGGLAMAAGVPVGWIALGYGLRLLVTGRQIVFALRRLGAPDLVWAWPLLDVGYMLVQLILFVPALLGVGQAGEWRERAR